MRRFLRSTWEVLKVAFVAVGAVVLIRNFLVQPFLVSGQSMVPTFRNGDYLLIDELTYRFREPVRGEVVVFRSPDDATFFIKRIIGLPGERVEIQDGRVRIISDAYPEGMALEEPYLPSLTVTGGGKGELGTGEYFVMGDNRSFSLDSRSWGSIDADRIVGLVRLRLWPVHAVQAFGAPHY
ncbi:MAG: signal peptidase I [Candidatus Liptonbacteria bacterium]|nr:signal peptidase I [Candidatus Liptonbacteria bacterium]